MPKSETQNLEEEKKKIPCIKFGRGSSRVTTAARNPQFHQRQTPRSSHFLCLLCIDFRMVEKKEGIAPRDESKRGLVWIVGLMGIRVIIVVMTLFLLLAGEKSVDWGIELVAALEEIELEDEDVTEEGSAELLDE